MQQHDDVGMKEFALCFVVIFSFVFWSLGHLGSWLHILPCVSLFLGFLCLNPRPGLLLF